jgi:GAF domain-containing protein
VAPAPPPDEGDSARPDRRKALELKAMAELCTDFGRLTDSGELPGLFDRAARLIEASGFIVWVAEAGGDELRPVLAHGYPAQALSRLPAIPRDADNATAAGWREGQMQVVKTNGMTPGALVAPLLTSGGCIGVLAAEVRHGRESSESVRALARIVASQIAALVAVPALATDAQAEPAQAQQH